MKKIILLMFLIFATSQTNAQIWTIASCSDLGTTVYGPMNSGTTANSTNRTAVIYPASQLTTLTGQVLNGMYFKRAGTAAMTGTPNFKIYLKEVTASDWGTAALDWATGITGATLVYDSNPATAVGNSLGYKPFPFSTNFIYGGVQNLAVFMEYTNPTALTTSIQWNYEYTAPCSNTALSTTTKYINTTTGILGASLSSQDYRRPLIGFDFVVTCPAPTSFLTSNITSSSVNLNWIAGGTETSWEYVVVPASNPTPAVGVSVTTNSAIVTGLNPNTFYKVLVRAVCSASDKSYWKDAGNIKTLCNDQTQFVENFESYISGTTSYADCWGKSNSTGSSYITTASVAPASPPNRLYMNCSATTTAVSVLPNVSNLQANTHRLVFKAYSTTAAKTLDVGYLTNPADFTSFVVLQNLAMPSTTAATALTFTVIPSGVPTTVKNLALRITGSAYTVYVDDVKWELNTTCIEPTAGFISTAVNDTMATITFTEPTPAAANGYEYFVSTSAVTPLNSVTPTGALPAFINSANLTGLTPNTNYFIYIRSKCSATSISNWSSSFAFSTSCAAVTAFTQNFDATTTLPSCWKKIGTTGTFSITTTTPASAPNALNISSSTTTNRIVMAMPPVSNAGAGTHRLKFDMRASATNVGGIVEVGYLTDFADATTFTAITSFTAATSVYSTVILNLGTTAGANQYLAFRHTGSPIHAVLIDNVAWEPIPACSEPTGLSVSNVQPTTVSISWLEPTLPAANGYEYFISATNTTPATTATPTGSVAAGLSTANATGLVANTSYFVWIRSVCTATEKSVWSAIFNFTTVCNPITTLPWIEGFEGLTGTLGTTNFPGCWFKQNGDWATAVATSYNTPNTGVNYIRNSWAATDEFMWTAGFQLTAGTSYDFSFFAQGDGFTGWNVNIFQNTAQTSVGATQLGTTYSPTGPGSQVIQSYNLVKNSFIPTTSGIYYFAIRVNQPSTAPWHIAFDDFRLALTPTCIDPTAIAVNATSSTTATAAWTAPIVAPANGYQYYVATTNTAPTATTTPTGSLAAGTTTASLTGLTASTVHYFWVRSVCSATDSSPWSPITTFNTTVAPGCTTPISPANGAVNIPAGSITLSWTVPATGGTVVSYDLFSGPTPASATTLIGNYTSASAVVNVNAFNTLVYWRVVAKNAGGAAVGCANWSFTTAANPGYCMINQYGSPYPATTYTPTTCDGVASNNVTTIGYASEYSNISVTAGQSYKFLSSVATDFITIGDATGSIAHAYSASGSVIWTATTAATVRFYTHADANCTAAAVSRTRSIVCGAALSTNTFDNDSFSYFPNPVQNILNLSYNSTITKVSIFNLLGQEVISKSINENLGQVDMSNLAAGTYLVKVFADGNIKNIKVVKE